MNEEDIKKMAREYAEDFYAEIPFGSMEAYQSAVLSLSEKVTSAFQWLSKDYVIVPKELIRKEYEKAQKTRDLYTSATCINEMESRAIDHAEGRMCELKTLFDKSLFEEEGV